MITQVARPQAGPHPGAGGTDSDPLVYIADDPGDRRIALAFRSHIPRLRITCAALDPRTGVTWLGSTRGALRLGPEGDITHIKLQNESIQACCWTPEGVWMAGERNILRLGNGGSGVQKISRLVLGMGDARVRSMSGDATRVCLVVESPRMVGLPLVWIDPVRGLHRTASVPHGRVGSVLAVHVAGGSTWVLFPDHVLQIDAQSQIVRVIEAPLQDDLAPWPWQGILPPRELGCIVSPLAQSTFLEDGNHLQFLLSGWGCQLDMLTGQVKVRPEPATLLRSLSTRCVDVGGDTYLLATHLGLFYSAGGRGCGGVVPLLRGQVVSLLGGDPVRIVTPEAVWTLSRRFIPRAPLRRIPGELGMDLLRRLVRDALDSPDPERRVAALKLLGHLPGVLAQDIPDRALLDDHAAVSEMAIRMLFHLAGTAAARRLRELFPGLHTDAQRNVIRVLIERGLAPPADCYRDLVRHPTVLSELLGLIDRLPASHARELVLECLVHPQVPLRSRARSALKWLAVDPDVMGLARDLASGYPTVRLEAARALPLTRDEVALHLVASQLPDMVPVQATAALQSLKKVLPSLELTLRLRGGLVLALSECKQFEGKPELAFLLKEVVQMVEDRSGVGGR